MRDVDGKVGIVQLAELYVIPVNQEKEKQILAISNVGLTL